MRLVKAGQWTSETFGVGSRPKKNIVLEWIREGVVPGRIIDGQPYVDVEGFALQPVEVSRAPSPPGDFPDLFS